jgi:hypothetical protein
MERYAVFCSRFFTVYLHRFVNGDGDRDTHSHPWRWAFAIILTGGYLETRVRWFDSDGPVKRYRVRLPGSLNVIRPTTFHQILYSEPDTWTLFVHGPRVTAWGFLRVGAQVPALWIPAEDSEGGTRWQDVVPVGAAAGREPMK